MAPPEHAGTDMNIYWSLVLVLFIVAILAGEVFALAKNKMTFSRYVWNASKAWPPLPLIVGLVLGFLLAHFWWGGALICYEAP